MEASGKEGMEVSRMGIWTSTPLVDPSD